MPDPTPYPLVLEPILMPKVWGGRRLAALGKRLPPDEPIGESWELADLPSTNPGGGGGDAARSLIANGALAGNTLHEAVERWGSRLLGSAKRTVAGGFPLLVKYLDAREHLSIQVHPSPEYARAHPEAHLKTESWFILDARPDSDGNPPVIYKGLNEGVTADDLRAAIESGTVPQIMRTELAMPGQCHTLPSGTVHALGAGVLVAEIQTPSDTTFRVYDWAREYGRHGRELHIQQAVACASFAPPPVATRAEAFTSDDMAGLSAMPASMGVTRKRVARTDFYSIDAVSASCAGVPLVEANDDRSTPVVVMLLRTTGASIVGGGVEHPIEAGRTVLAPASIAADCVLRAGPGTEALIARVG